MGFVMLNLNVAFTPYEKIDYSAKTVIVLDILRASSTLVTAFAGGCRSVFPAAEVPEAHDLLRQYRQALLCGERGGLKPQGFYLGNSPLEYQAEIIKGCDLIFTTSNGTRAILAAQKAQCILIGSFLNLDTVMERASKENSDIVLLCAGNDGAFSFEDALCAGIMCEQLRKRKSDLMMTDSARWALAALEHLFQRPDLLQPEPLAELLVGTEHGQKILALGFIDDIRHCAKLNLYPVVPYYANGKLII